MGVGEEEVGGGEDSDDDDEEEEKEKGQSDLKLSGNRLQKSFFHAFAHFLWNKPHHEPRTATGRRVDDSMMIYFCWSSDGTDIYDKGNN